MKFEICRRCCFGQMTNTSNSDEVELPHDPSTSLLLYSDTNTLLDILAAKAKYVFWEAIK